MSKRKELSLVELEKFADLLGVDLDDLFLNDLDEKVSKFIKDIKRLNLTQSDLDHIASFNRVVKNYVKMKEINGNKE